MDTAAYNTEFTEASMVGAKEETKSVNCFTLGFGASASVRCRGESRILKAVEIQSHPCLSDLRPVYR